MKKLKLKITGIMAVALLIVTILGVTTETIQAKAPKEKKVKGAMVADQVYCPANGRVTCNITE